MEVNAILSNTESAMQKAIEHFDQELAKVRTGRASASLLDGVKVDYYGASTPLNQVATVSVPEPRTILVQPWERSLIGEIERAIMQANLGLNPASDGVVVRVPVPLLTEERRKEYVKQCKKIAEDSRVAVRNQRRDANEALKKAESDANLPEDERKRAEGDVQKLTDKYIKTINEKLDAKEAQIMEI